jgi:hypothetical protein
MEWMQIVIINGFANYGSDVSIGGHRRYGKTVLAVLRNGSNGKIGPLTNANTESKESYQSLSLETS